MKELNHEQLAYLYTCRTAAYPPMANAMREWAKSVCWTREPLLEFSSSVIGRYGTYSLTPRGRALVDVALAAVNAELKGADTVRFDVPFTCPQCGSHAFGSSGCLTGPLVRHCNGIGCRFSFPETDDHLHFTINDTRFESFEAFRAEYKRLAKLENARMRRGAVAKSETFEQAWACMEAQGYQYGEDALEQVRFGFELARGTRD